MPATGTDGPAEKTPAPSFSEWTSKRWSKAAGTWMPTAGVADSVTDTGTPGKRVPSGGAAGVGAVAWMSLSFARRTTPAAERATATTTPAAAREAQVVVERCCRGAGADLEPAAV